MNLPLYPNEYFGRPFGMVVGTLTGVVFGFVLERAGFGRAPNLAAQFYGTDMRVFKVMFTGIATAAAGLGLLGGFGLVDLAQLTIPETFLWPQLIGGLLLGAGFNVAGYCPGTACVATASGHVDGLITYVGVGLGTLVFGAFYPQLQAFYTGSNLGVVRLDLLLGVPFGVVAAGVVVLAVACFFGAEALERIFTRRNAEAQPIVARPFRNRAMAVMLALAVIAVVPAFATRSASATAVKRATAIDATTLARQLAQEPSRLQVVDMRAPEACHQHRVPAATCRKDEKGDWPARLLPTRAVVLYGEADLRQVPAELARFPGEVLILRGGFPAFQHAILDPPVAPTETTLANLAAYRAQSALHTHFTGQQAAPIVQRAPSTSTGPAAPAAKKGGGC